MPPRGWFFTSWGCGALSASHVRLLYRTRSALNRIRRGAEEGRAGPSDADCLRLVSAKAVEARVPHVSFLPVIEGNGPS